MTPWLDDRQWRRLMADADTIVEDPSLLVLLDLTCDSGAMATMNAEAAGYLGWSLNGQRIEHDGDHCYVIFGHPWDPSATNAENDEQAGRDLATVLAELDGAGLPWQEV